MLLCREKLLELAEVAAEEADCVVAGVLTQRPDFVIVIGREYTPHYSVTLSFPVPTKLIWSRTDKQLVQWLVLTMEQQLNSIHTNPDEWSFDEL